MTAVSQIGRSCPFVLRFFELSSGEQWWTVWCAEFSPSVLFITSFATERNWSLNIIGKFRFLSWCFKSMSQAGDSQGRIQSSRKSLGFELGFWVFVSSLETPDLWCSFSKIKSSRCLCKNCLEALILNHLSLIIIRINNETILLNISLFQSQFESEFLYIHWRSIHSNNH